MCSLSQGSLRSPGHCARESFLPDEILAQAVTTRWSPAQSNLLALAPPSSEHGSARTNSVGGCSCSFNLCPVVPQLVHVFLLFWLVFQPCDLKLLILFRGQLAEGFFKSSYISGEIYNKTTNMLEFSKVQTFLERKRKIEKQRNRYLRLLGG